MFALQLLSFVTIAAAHVDFNFPLGQWDHTEEQQETGAFCGGGTPGTPWAWGIYKPFVSVSGDPGQQITVKFVTNNATTPSLTPGSESDFAVTLIQNAIFPDSGNFCANVTIPCEDSIVPGAAGVLYVEVGEPGGNTTISTCTSNILIPNYDLASQIVFDSEGNEVLNSHGEPYTYFAYYCSNGTIPAHGNCDCHCHGTEAHCSGNCTSDQEAQAGEDCAGIE